MASPWMYLLNSLLTTLLLIHAPVQENSSTTAWKLAKEQENIQVFKADAANSDYKKIKVEAVMEGKWENIIPVFQDIDNYANWVYATERSYLVEKRSDQEYSTTSKPIYPGRQRIAIRLS